MAFAFSRPYSSDALFIAQSFHRSLSEKDRRRYAATEARRLGHGAVKYIASAFRCSRRTIERGLGELDRSSNTFPVERVRRPGGGRKKRSTLLHDSSRICGPYSNLGQQATPTMLCRFGPISALAESPIS